MAAIETLYQAGNRADDGPCDICMHPEKDREKRLSDESVIYNYSFQIEKTREMSYDLR